MCAFAETASTHEWYTNIKKKTVSSCRWSWNYDSVLPVADWITEIYHSKEVGIPVQKKKSVCDWMMVFLVNSVTVWESFIWSMP